MPYSVIFSWFRSPPPPRHENHRRRRADLLDGLGDFQPGHVGHAEVRDDQIEGVVLKCLETFARVGDALDFEAHGVEPQF